jgi:isocitrate/isopropylmalate dehydrogenase
MKGPRIVVIEGEDAAPEAVRPTLALLDQLGLGIEWLRPPVGDAAWRTHGSGFPDETRQAIDASAATLFGATNGASAAALFYLRWGKGTYANVRPTRWVPGYNSPLRHPEGIDLVIVRENLEDLYVGIEGNLDQLVAAGMGSGRMARKLAELGPGKFAVKLITEQGAERVVRFSFELARRRKAQGRPGKLAVAAKHNVLPESDGLFVQTAARVATSFPDIAFEVFFADDFARRLVQSPRDIDVAVLPNLYGDLLSDEAAGIVGGLGLAPSGCYGDAYAYFESVHGSAPDIAGKNVINPTATILSAAMMLEYLGFDEPARRIESAVERVYEKGDVLTLDQGGRASTTEFCEAVAGEL